MWLWGTASIDSPDKTFECSEQFARRTVHDLSVRTAVRAVQDVPVVQRFFGHKLVGRG